MKNKKEKTYKLILNKEQLGIVQTALEAYSRMKMGQIKYGMGEIFPQLYPAELESIEGFVRNVVNYSLIQREKEPIFPSDPNSSWGYGHEKTGDGSEAFVVMQAVRQFLAVERNGGYFDPMFVTYDDPISWGREDKHVPEIEGFIKYKDFYIDSEEDRRNGNRSEVGNEAVKRFKDKDWKYLHENVFNKEFLEKNNVRGEKYQIMIDRHEENCFFRVYKPSKIKNESDKVISIQNTT